MNGIEGEESAEKTEPLPATDAEKDEVMAELQAEMEKEFQAKEGE